MECAAVREFTAIHNMIRGLAKLLDSALSAAKPENPQHMKVLSDLGLFGVAGTRFHHKGEDDSFWPAIVANGADATLLDPLVKEHHEIDPLLDETERAFAALTDRPQSADTMKQLVGIVDRFQNHLLTHLDHEEPIFFPLLTKYMPDEEAHALAARISKHAPRKGLSWLMGGVEYAMTKDQAREFLATFPKPVLWLRPRLLRRYKKNCDVLGLDPAIPSQK